MPTVSKPRLATGSAALPASGAAGIGASATGEAPSAPPACEEGAGALPAEGSGPAAGAAGLAL